jgi:hypothetical protein
VVKNGWVYRNVVDDALPDLLALEGAAFLAGRFELLAFLAIDLSPKCAEFSTFTAAAVQCR